MKYLGEVWERDDDGMIGVIIAASPRTKHSEVLLSGLPSWIPYDDLPVLGWTRLPWCMTLDPVLEP